MTHCRAPASAFKLFAMAGSATLTTDPSTKARPEASVVQANTSVGCGDAAAGLGQCAAMESQKGCRALMSFADARIAKGALRRELAVVRRECQAVLNPAPYLANSWCFLAG